MQLFAIHIGFRQQMTVCSLLPGYGGIEADVDANIRRIHHPSGAALLETPVRARFCKRSDLLIRLANRLLS